jgi:hypothetical protein
MKIIHNVYDMLMMRVDLTSYFNIILRVTKKIKS